MIKAILFDLGGTLFDFAKIDTRAVFQQAGHATYDYLAERGHVLPPFKKYFRKHYRAVILSYAWSVVRRRGEFNVYDLVVDVCRKLRVTIDPTTQRDLGHLWYEPCLRQTSIAPDVLPALNKFRERGYKLAIVSNTCIPAFLLDIHLAQHDLLEFFPVRIYSSDIGRRKPHPLPFELALQAVKAAPDEALFVGDTVKTDIVGARRMGIRSVLRDVRKSSSAYLADHVIQNISELHRLLPALPASRREELPALEDLAYEG